MGDTHLRTSLGGKPPYMPSLGVVNLPICPPWYGVQGGVYHGVQGGVYQGGPERVNQEWF